MKLIEKITNTLISTNKTLCIAESCTGGLLSHLLTNVSGSSAFLMGSVVSYSNKSKCALLNVSSSNLKTYGAVSQPVALQMAKGMSHKIPCDYALSITGIAGPTGGTIEKPVGLVYIAIYSKNGADCIKCQFKGSRIEIKEKSAEEALLLLHCTMQNSITK